jgi:uncharacterized protein DUF4255/carboxypeptidase family protein
MIRDLSLTLQAILDDAALAADFPELFAAQIAFERPSDTFSPGSTTVDLFLFDIRENTELRSNEPETARVNGEIVISRPPLRVACSYLVTAWPTGGGDLALAEHRLLGQALQVLSRHRHIPEPFLRGGLVGQQPPLPMMTAHADGVREPHEFWAAIGNKMRPSFVVTVTIGMELHPAITAPEVVSSRIRVDLSSAASPGAARFRFGGLVTDAGGAAVPDADVKLVEAGLTARTDGEGRYQIGAVGAGTYSLQVTKGPQGRTVSVTLPPDAPGAFDVQLT